jgi:hypothetical protein
VVNTLLVGPDTPLGLTQGTKNNAALNAFMISDLKAMGIRWLRWQPYAYSIELSQGQYTWGNLDSVVQQCNAQGINLMLTVLFPPAWGLSGGFPTPSWSLQFAQAMASRYDGNHGHGQIQGIELGNEDYTISGDNPTALAATMNACYQPLKNAYPNLIVGSGCCIHRNKGVVPGYYQTLWQKAPAKFDYINFHFYCQNNNSSDPSVDGAGFYSYDTLIAALQQANSNAGHPHFPIWITETGWPINTNGFTQQYVVTQQQQWNYEKYVLDKSRALPNQPIKIFLYTLAYVPQGGSPSTGGTSQGMSLYQGQHGAAGSFATIAYNQLGSYPQNWGGGSSTGLAQRDWKARARIRSGTATAIKDWQARARLKALNATTQIKDWQARARIADSIGTTSWFYDLFQRFPQPAWSVATDGENWVQASGLATPSIVFASNVNVLGQDSFARGNVSNGWGTGTDGQTWNVLSGASAAMSVLTNHARISNANSVELRYGSHTSANFDIRCRVQPNDNSDFAGPMGRLTDTDNWYWLFFDAQFLFLKKRVTGSETTLASPAISYTLGNWYWMRFVGIGSTLYARWWADGSLEPSTWDIVVTDSSLSSAAGIGFLGQAGSATPTQMDSFTAIDFLASKGIITGATGTNTLRLGTNLLTDADGYVRFIITQPGDIVGLTLRDNGLNHFIRLRQTASQLQLVQQTPSGGFVTIASSAFVPVGNTAYWLRFRALSQALVGKIWQDGSLEPDWQVAGSTTVLSPGQIGLIVSLSQAADSVSFDDFAVAAATQSVPSPNARMRDFAARARLIGKSSTQLRDFLARARIVDLDTITVTTGAVKRRPLNRRVPKS